MKNTSHHEKTDLNKPVDNYGGTAIYKASAKSLEEVMELVKMGADVNIPNKGGNTPIHIATVSGKYDIFVYLAKNGANLYSLDNQREGLLSKAVDKKQTQIVKYLLQNTNQNASHIGGLLIKAVKYGLDEMAIDLIELGGADANITTQEGQNLLQLSLNSNNEKLIKYFVEEKKLNVNHTDGEGKTVLFYGIDNGIMVDYLQSYGAALSNTDLPFCLKQFVKNKDYKKVQELVEQRKLDLNNPKLNLIDIAIENKDCQMLEYLVKHGANINIQYDTFLPWHHLENIINYNQHRMLEQEELKIIKFLLQSGCVFEIKNCFLDMRSLSQYDSAQEIENRAKKFVQNAQITKLLALATNVDNFIKNKDIKILTHMDWDFFVERYISIIRKIGYENNLQKEIEKIIQLKSIPKSCKAVLLKILSHSLDDLDASIIKIFPDIFKKINATDYTNFKTTNENIFDCAIIELYHTKYTELTEYLKQHLVNNESLALIKHLLNKAILPSDLKDFINNIIDNFTQESSGVEGNLDVDPNEKNISGELVSPRIYATSNNQYYTDIIKKLNEYLIKNPNSEDAYLKIINSYFSLLEIDIDIKGLENSDELLKAKNIYAQELCNTSYQLAALYENQKLYEKEIATYINIYNSYKCTEDILSVEIKPENYSSLDNKIKHCFEEWLKTEETNYKLWIIRGDYYALVDKKDKAEEYYKQALLLNNDEEFKEIIEEKINDLHASSHYLSPRDFAAQVYGIPREMMDPTYFPDTEFFMRETQRDGEQVEESDDELMLVGNV